MFFYAKLRGIRTENRSVILPLFSQITISILLTVAAMVLLTIVPVIRLHHNPARLHLMMFMLTVVARCLFASIRTVTTDLNAKIFLGNVESIVAMIAPVFAILLALTFIQQYRWTRRPWSVIYFVIPALAGILIATNGYHHLIWTDYIFVPEYNVVEFVRGPFFPAIAVYLNLMVLAVFIMFVWAVINFRHVYRSQAVMLLLSMLPPWILSTLNLSGWLPNGVNVTPAGYGLTALIMAWSYLRHQLFNLIPIAHDLVIENMPDGVIVQDQTGRIVDINPAGLNLLRLSRPTVIGQPGHIALAATPGLLSHLHGERNTPHTASRVFIENTGYLDLRGGDISHRGQKIGCLLSFRDVSAQQTLEDELHRARNEAEAGSRAKSAFLANMSHELHSPLGLLKLGVNTLRRVNLDESARDFTLQTMTQEIDHLELMMDNLLEMSQLDKNPLQPNLTPTDLIPLLEKSIKAAQAYARSVQAVEHQIRLADPARPLWLALDALRIEQLFRNLLHNAIKYSPSHSITVIRVKPQTNAVLIEMQDRGYGIPPAEHNKIFERFYRFKDDARPLVRGAGLGLALCREIAEAHAGRIWLESEPGRGSIFFIELPSPHQKTGVPQ